nr:MFS transporter [uncultured Caproiciproducens sp.]
MKISGVSKRLSILCFATMTISGFYATSSSLVMPFLRTEYGFSYNMGGMLLSALSVGNLLASFFAGILPAFVGRKASAMLLSVNSAIGYVLTALTANPVYLLLAFFLIGISKGAVYNISNIVISEESSNRTKGLNLLHASFAIGSLLCPFVVAACSKGPLGWRTSCYGIAAVAFCLQLMYLKSDLGGKPPAKEHVNTDWGFLHNKGFWVSTGIIFFEISTEVSVTGWLVTYFTDSGLMSLTMAQLMLSLTWGLMMIGRLTIAYLPAKLGRKKLIAWMSVAVALFFALMLFCKRPVLIIVFLCLFALSIAGIQPTALANLDQKYTAPAALSVLLSLGSAGGIIMPAITGAVAQTTGISGGMAAIGFAITAMIICTIANLTGQPNHKSQVTAEAGKTRKTEDG